MDKNDVVKLLIKIQKLLNVVGTYVNNVQFKKDILLCMEDMEKLIKNYTQKGEMNMNNVRRKKLEEARDYLNRANNIIEDVMNDEDFAFNNLSEGLQQTLRGEQMENNVSELEEAMEHIEEVIDNLDNIE